MLACQTVYVCLEGLSSPGIYHLSIFILSVEIMGEERKP